MAHTDDALAAAAQAVRAASAAIDAAGTPERFTKADASPVTLADLAAQCAATAILERMLPAGFRLAGEEGEEHSLGGTDADAALARVASILEGLGLAKGIDGVRRLLARGSDHGGSGSFWTIDPLDGTKGYLRGEQYAVALARIDDGRPTVAALACPRLPLHGVGPAAAGTEGTLALATRGGGAWQEGLSGRAPRAQVHAAPWKPGTPVRLGESVESSHASHERAVEMLRPAGPVERHPMDSQAKYALLARGEIDCYLRVPPKSGYAECIWDQAAGTLLATEAGCLARDGRGGELDFGRGLRLQPGAGVFCGTSALSKAVFGR